MPYPDPAAPLSAALDSAARGWPVIPRSLGTCWPCHNHTEENR
jgi:hypothetical protein